MVNFKKLDKELSIEEISSKLKTIKNDLKELGVNGVSVRFFVKLNEFEISYSSKDEAIVNSYLNTI